MMTGDPAPGGRAGRPAPSRRWPFALLVGMAAAVELAVARGSAPLAADVLLWFAAYFAGSKLPRRFSIPVTLAAGAVIGGTLVAAAQTRTHEQLATLALVGFLPLVAAWFVGDAVAARRRYQAGLAEQAARQQAAEAERAHRQVREQRVRIAQELHDIVAHTLSVITVQAGVGRRLMAKRPEEASKALASIETIGRTAQEELRVVLDLLREEGVSAAELSPAPRLIDVKELVETVRTSGTEIELLMAGTDRQLSPALEASLYRVIQEALTNVVKHAPRARATVDVVVSDGKVRVEVANDGTTFEVPSSTDPGHGIIGMRERMAAFGGSIVADALPGGGFRVLAEVPVAGS